MHRIIYYCYNPGLRDDGESQRKVPYITGEELREIPAMIMSSTRAAPSPSPTCLTASAQ